MCLSTHTRLCIKEGKLDLRKLYLKQTNKTQLCLNQSHSGEGGGKNVANKKSERRSKGKKKKKGNPQKHIFVCL